MSLPQTEKKKTVHKGRALMYSQQLQKKGSPLFFVDKSDGGVMSSLQVRFSGGRKKVRQE